MIKVLFFCAAALALVLIFVGAAAWAARSQKKPTPTQQTDNPYRRFYDGRK